MNSKTSMINFATSSGGGEVKDCNKEKSVEFISEYPSNAVSSNTASCYSQLTPFWWIEGLLLSLEKFQNMLF